MHSVGAKVLRLYVALGVSFAHTAAFAQQVPGADTKQTYGTESGAPQAGALEEIVVTATKREGRLQDAPLSVTALSGDTLARSGVVDISGVADAVPNLHIGESGANTAMIITIRGVTANVTSVDGDPATAFHVDGVYVPRPTAAGAMLYDVARVEVLRGPQGTLWGRNATGGAIDVVTRRPSLDGRSHGYASAVAGDYDRLGAEAALDMTALPDKLGFRVAMRGDRHDGYARNASPDFADTADGREYAGRASALYEPTDRFSIFLSGDHYRRTGQGAGTSNLVLDRDDPFRIETNSPTNVDIITTSGRAQLTYRGDVLDLVSISGYRHDDTFSLSDLDAGPVETSRLNFTADGDAFSQEVRVSNKATEHLRWLLGGYYFSEETTDDREIFIDLPAAAAPNILRIFDEDRTTRSYAALASAELDLNETVTLLGGIRYTTDHKEQLGTLTITNFLLNGTGPTVRLPPLPDNIRDEWSKVTWKAGVNWKVSPQNLLYASASTGFKSGGFNTGIVTVLPQLTAYDPESLLAFEVGSKNSIADGRGTLNISAFHYRYTDLQETQLVQPGFQLTANAARAKLWGAEIELASRPIEAVNVVASLAYLHSRFDAFTSFDSLAGNRLVDVAGNQLPKAPRWNGNVHVEYAASLGPTRLVLSGDVHFESRSYMDEFNGVGGPGRELMVQPSFVKTDLGARLQNIDNTLYLQLFWKNVADKRILRRGFVGASGDIVGNYEPPRTIAVQVGVNF